MKTLYIIRKVLRLFSVYALTVAAVVLSLLALPCIAFHELAEWIKNKEVKEQC